MHRTHTHTSKEDIKVINHTHDARIYENTRKRRFDDEN